MKRNKMGFAAVAVGCACLLMVVAVTRSSRQPHRGCPGDGEQALPQDAKAWIRQLQSANQAATWAMLAKVKGADVAEYMPWSRQSADPAVVSQSVAAWLTFLRHEALAIPQDEKPLTTEHRRAQMLAEHFLREGSVTSLVLRDSVLRILVLHDLHFAANHPGKAKALLTDRRFIIPKAFSRAAIRKTIPANFPAKARATILAGLKKDDAHVAEAIIGDIFNPHIHLGSSYIAGHHDVMSLIYRMIQTTALKQLHLAGFVDYLSAGGTVAELQSGNVYKVLPHMRASGVKRTCPLFGNAKLGPGQLAIAGDIATSQKAIPRAFQSSFR